jgi:hypothetical protein
VFALYRMSLTAALDGIDGRKSPGARATSLNASI